MILVTRDKLTCNNEITDNEESINQVYYFSSTLQARFHTQKQ